MPKITKARGATSRFDGSNRLPPKRAEKEPEAETSPAPTRPRVKDGVKLWRAYAEAIGVSSEGSKKKIIERVKAAE